ncbi:cytochrome P450 [Micrococcus luteus]|uniref:cytochrome P450 n=1 Tax=Micrococcus luteus TaxID=1270 RepID=UPI001C8E52B6|nr:cytochrome P450 [Micrococcus luteus]MBY0170680.1 cytochrome P450 [Micrococcus luteus]
MTLTVPRRLTPASARPAPVADWVSIPQLYTDPFPTFERLRAEGGVHWVPAVNRYLITTYSAVHTTELDQETFSANEDGSLMKRAMGHPMLRKDDPEHHPERRAYMPTLKPATVKKVWTQIFHRQADRFVAELREKGPGADLVWDFAAPFTAESLRAVTGLHNVTQADLQRWSQCLIDATGNYADDPEVWARGAQASEEVDAALDEMIEWHLRHPDHSLISGLLSFPDYQMPLESIRSNLKMTIGGGLNEPRDAIGVATWALLRDPAQRALVAEDDSRWHAVFHEAIRWVAPIGMYSRQVTRDTVLDGVHLPAGARLGICLLSANRDETQWKHPERFDLTRTGEGAHLAFGKGVHVCAGAWVARAQVADVALPHLFRSLPGLGLDPDREAIPGGWVFRGMDTFPVLWDEPGRRRPQTDETAADTTAEPTDALAGENRHIAVVGAGPAGCFTAQALRRELPGARVTVLDRRPTPYGLIRSGVAGDHQGTKSVADQFARVFENEDVDFVGGVRVRHGEPAEDVVLTGRPGVFGPALRSQDADGAELTLAQLREAFDAVVIATGLDADRALLVPGGDLPGVYGAGRLTRWLNGDPVECAAVAAGAAVRIGPRPAVVGLGNVAMDVVRLLARDRADVDGTDILDDAHAALSADLQELHVIGRSSPAEAAFDPVMLREIAALPGVSHTVHGLTPEDETAEDPRSSVVRALPAQSAPESRLHVHWWFGTNPDAVTAHEGAVTGLRIRVRGEEVALPVTSVVTAIGFTDGQDALLPQAEIEPEARESGRVEPGLYLAGWARRGPRGTIPTQRADAKALAVQIAADLADAERGPDTWRGLGVLRPYLDRASDYEGWLRIDAAERAETSPGRPRRKMTDARRQRLLSRGAWEPLGRRDAGPTPSGEPDDGRPPLRIVYGTESGNAEVVAEALAVRLAERFATSVQDLADVAPEDLAGESVAVVVCSTYGDGELPSSARGFYERLTGGGQRLDGLTVVPFGLGDRTYGTTYTRGIDLMCEALTAASATLAVEPGRHDAASGLAAADVACTWVQDHLPLLTRSATADDSQ